MSKKPSYFDGNLRQLIALCELEGYGIEPIGSDGQYRVYGATHVFDIWPSRMVYHRIRGEVILAQEPFHRNLDQQFNLEQVTTLLATGEYNGKA